MDKIISILDKEIIQIINFIRKENDDLNKKGLINFLIDEIKIQIPNNYKEIMVSLNVIKNNIININENNANNILSIIDNIIDSIDNLEDKINEEVDKIFLI